MLTQKECVYSAITGLFGGEYSSEAVKLDKDMLKEVYECVTEQIVLGNCAFSDDAKLKYSTPELIRTKYVPGMVSNWIRKDTRLNGGEPYVIKNPGSRAG